MKKLKELWSIIVATFKDWSARDLGTDAASLAYSAIFSVPGLLIIIIWVAGIFFGAEAVRGEITQYIGSMMGKNVGKQVEEMVVSGMIDKENIWMKAFGVATLVFGATSLFFQLQKSLNKLWDVEAAPKKAWQKFILDRANSLGLILVIAFLLLITLLLSSFIGMANDWIVAHFSVETYLLVQLLNIGVGFMITMVLFGFMFKVLPDVELPWKSVWTGAFTTTLLFTVGKYLITYYFENFNPTSAFGAAGTVILLMLWVNYTCQLIFLGAEFTKVYSQKKGLAVKPSRHAKWNPQMIAEDKKTQIVCMVDAETDEDRKTPDDSMI